MDRKNINLDELDKRVQKHGPNIGMANVQVEGICTIFRKDGSIKGTMRVCSVEEAEKEYAERIEKWN